MLSPDWGQKLLATMKKFVTKPVAVEWLAASSTKF